MDWKLRCRPSALPFLFFAFSSLSLFPIPAVRCADLTFAETISGDNKRQTCLMLVVIVLCVCASSLLYIYIYIFFFFPNARILLVVIHLFFFSLLFLSYFRADRLFFCVLLLLFGVFSVFFFFMTVSVALVFLYYLSFYFLAFFAGTQRS